MAWSDILNNLLGMRQLSQSSAERSRDRQMELLDKQIDISRYNDVKNKGWLDSLKEPLQRLQTQRFQSGEAEKSREFQAGESAKQREFTTEEREAMQIFQREAQNQDYTYEYTYTHPWSGKSITLYGDGSTATHELNNTRLREFINMWNAYMQKDLKGDLPDQKGMMIDEAASRIRSSIANQAGEFFNIDGTPKIEEYGDYSAWADALFTKYDRQLEILVNNYAEEHGLDPFELKDLVYAAMEEEAPEVPPEEPDPAELGGKLKGGLDQVVGLFGNKDSQVAAQIQIMKENPEIAGMNEAFVAFWAPALKASKNLTPQGMDRQEFETELDKMLEVIRQPRNQAIRASLYTARINFFLQQINKLFGGS